VSIAAQVRQTGGPVRVHSFARATGPIAREAQQLGIRSSVGCPIVVAGRLWGSSPPRRSGRRRSLRTPSRRSRLHRPRRHRDRERGESRGARPARRPTSRAAQGGDPGRARIALGGDLRRRCRGGRPDNRRGRHDHRAARSGRADHHCRQAGRAPRGHDAREPLEDRAAADPRGGTAHRQPGPPRLLQRAFRRRHRRRGLDGNPVVDRDSDRCRRPSVGALGAGSVGGPFPPDTETRVLGFAELAGIAIANAQNRAEVAASAPGSLPPPTRRDGALNETCTTVPSNASSPWDSNYA